MKLVCQAAALALAISSVGTCQTPARPTEFDAAVINAAAPPSSHFQSPASSKGGPGTPDPTLYRCTNCDLAFLISKAFDLERYQFPGQSSLSDAAFDVSARVPEGATPAQFAEMLRNLLKEKFGLAYHFDQKQILGYDLVVARNGAHLKESTDTPKSPLTDADKTHQDGAGNSWHRAGDDGGHEASRPGLFVFGGRARYKAEQQTIADLARMIANQLAKPVDDHTGLTGKYDIALSWSDDGSHAASHLPGGGAGGDHAGHGGETYGGTATPSDGAPGLTLMEVLQTQLGLKLDSKKVPASIFVIDHIEKSPAPK